MRNRNKKKYKCRKKNERNKNERKSNLDREYIDEYDRELSRGRSSGRDRTFRRDKDCKRDKGSRRGKGRKRIFVLVLMIIVILLIMFLVSLYNWNKIIKDVIRCENSVVLDSTGNVIAVLGESRIQENVHLSQIPQDMVHAYIAIEDKNFYKHKGINLKRTAKAVGSYVFRRGSASFGGSTITQQLVKNVTGDNETKISRKVQEWDRAIKTELALSKDEILETYFNIIYVGPNVYGVEKGAEYYFDKKVSELDLAECAFMAGLNHSPNSYNPFSENDNSDKIKSRTTTVLNVMLQEGYITNEAYNLAIDELEAGLKFKKGKVEPKGDAVYSYMVDATIADVVKDLEEKKDMSTSFATNYLYFSGLRIYSTQNSDIQKEIEKECEMSRYIVKSNEHENATSQAAMIVIDNKTGQVKGCVGGLGKKTVPRGLNRATQSLRQTGSAIKPIAILGPALEEKIITPATIYDDKKTTFADNYSPDNCENELGEITVRRAVESSQNIPFVKIMEQLTPEKSMKYLEKQGISDLTDADKNLWLALGGLEKGSSPLQMAVAYVCIANGGTYIEPTFYTKVENNIGKVILKTKQESKKVYSEDTSYVLKKLLTQPVNGANGTAKNCKIDGIETAAKTGTTNDNYDKWLCGFTKYYTAVTWFGFDSNESINEGSSSMASQIWVNVMRNVHKDLIKAGFDRPKGVQEVQICGESGKVAGQKCKNVYTEYFRNGTAPKESCGLIH